MNRQTRDRIIVYLVTIISYLNPFSNLIISLSYHAHQSDPKNLYVSAKLLYFNKYF